MFQAVISIIILCSSVVIIVQNYPYWTRHHDGETLLWVLFGIVSICAALFFLSIQYDVIQITTDNAAFLTWSQRVLSTFVFAGWIILGIRMYILKK